MIDIGHLHDSITPVGSRVTCDPAPTHTDRDWLVLVTPAKVAAFEAALIGAGWMQGGSDIPDASNETEPDDRFHSFTFTVDGVVENVIATSGVAFHRRFLAATSVAKLLNLQAKHERIALFQAVLYANGCPFTTPVSVPADAPADLEFDF